MLFDKLFIFIKGFISLFSQEIIEIPLFWYFNIDIFQSI